MKLTLGKLTFDAEFFDRTLGAVTGSVREALDPLWWLRDRAGPVQTRRLISYDCRTQTETLTRLGRAGSCGVEIDLHFHATGHTARANDRHDEKSRIFAGTILGRTGFKSFADLNQALQGQLARHVIDFDLNAIRLGRVPDISFVAELEITRVSYLLTLPGEELVGNILLVVPVSGKVRVWETWDCRLGKDQIEQGHPHFVLPEEQLLNATSPVAKDILRQEQARRRAARKAAEADVSGLEQSIARLKKRVTDQIERDRRRSDMTDQERADRARQLTEGFEAASAALREALQRARNHLADLPE